MSEDELVFDEDFVRAAARREPTAAERAEAARRVASDHRRLADSGGQRAGGAKRNRRRRHAPRTWVTALLTVLVVAGLLVAFPHALHQPAVSASAHPPRPSDAKDHRLLPAVTGPAGTGGYAFQPELKVNGTYLRWDPCRPIHYVVRHDREPVGGAELVADAIREISRDTGLTFVNDGSTDERPSHHRPLVDRRRYGNRWSPVLVAWATVAEVPELKGNVDGLAGPAVADDNGLHLVSGQVALDEAQLTEQGRRDVYLVMMHELGHLVGLQHAKDPTQLMYPVLDGQTGLGKGDLRGLAAAGAGPCVTFA